MKKIFTKIVFVIAAFLLVAGLSAPAFAQAPITTITPDAGVSAIAKDGSGNTYVIEDPGSFDVGGHPTTSGQIVRYTNGSGASKVVYSGAFIANNDFANSDGYAFGIAVDASKNIYFTTSIGQSYTYGAIIKLTYNSGTDSYSDGGSPFLDFSSQGGNVGYPTGIAIDGSNNLYVLLYDINATSDGFGAYTVAKFAPGSTSYTEIYKGFELKATYNSNETYSSICAIAVDPSGNVYAADWYDTRLETYAGFIEKLTWNGGNNYTASTLYNTNTYCQALGCDASGNLYANIGSGSDEETTVKLVKFTNGAGSPTTIYAGLNGESDYWCFGMAVTGSDIFTGQGNEGSQSQGYYMHIVAPPTTPASGVSFSSTTGNSTSISWTNGDGAERAVFVEQGTSGSPTLTNGTTYSANTSFNGGSTAGSGWYCVYNGTGSSVNVTNLSPSTSYRVMVVEYDGTSSLTNYDTGTGSNNPNNVTTATPTIGSSGAFSSLTTTAGAASSSESITVSGANLVANVTATVPSGFDVSLNNSTWSGSGGSQTITQSGGTISGQTVYIRLDAGDAVNFYSGNLSLSSTGASTVNVPIPTCTVTVPVISESGTLSALSTNAGTASASESFSVSGANMEAGILVTPPAGFEVSLNNSSFSSTVTVGSSGNISSTPVYIRLLASDGNGNYSGNVALTSFDATTINVSMPSSSVTTPTIGESGSLSALSTTAGTASSSESFSVSGSNMVGGILVTPPSGFEVSLNNSSFSSTVTVGSSGTIASTPVYIRLAASDAANTYSGNVALTSTGATTVNVSMPSSSVTTPTTTISSLTAVGGTNTNASSVQYTATFAASVSGLSASNFTIPPSGVSGAFVSNVLQTSGTTYTITVNTGSGDGALQLEMNSSSGLSQSITNLPFSGTTYTIDKTAPTISIGPPSASVTSGGPITYTVTYFDNNFNSSSLATGNIMLNKTGTANGTVGVSAGAGTFRTVTISGITGDGSLGISIAAGTAFDLAGNAAPASSPSTTFTVDNTPPTALSLAAQDPTPTNETQLDYTITFSEGVTGVDPGDFTTVTTGGVTAGAISVTPTSSSTYNLSISNVSGNGTLQINLNSSGTGIADLAGNPISGGINGDTYTVDQTPPTVSSITATTPSNANPTNATSLTYTVTFSEAVTGVSQTSFTGNNLTGTVSYSGITVTPVSSSVYSVTLNGISGDGTIRLDLNSSNTGIFDLAVNPISGGFTSGDVYTIDNTPPALNRLVYSSSNANGSFAKTGDVITLAFGANEALQAPTVTIAGHSITATNIGGNNYSASYTMTSGDTEGRIPFNLTIADLAGNSGNYNDVAAGDNITFDMTAPTAMIGPPSVATIGTGGAGTVTYTVTYADVNFNSSNLNNGGITLNTSGTATGTVNVTGAGTSYTVTISAITGLGTLGITVGPGFATDLAGNADGGAGPSGTFNVVSSDATLSNLITNVGKISPAFTAGTLSYTRNVVFGVHAITVTPTATDPNATILINGTEEVPSGTASLPISLNVGSGNVITVQVTAEDGTTTQSYTITVTRGASSNTNLTALVLNPGIKSPGFTSGNTSYTASVVHAVTSTIVTPTTGDPNATVTVDGTPVASGTPSGPIPLSIGQNTITVTVTAQDGVATKTYTVVVTRAGSTDADLTFLRFNPGIKMPIFMSDVTSYTASVVNGVSSTIVTPTATDPDATITVNNVAVASGTASGVLPLNVGPNVITTTVTASDGVSTKTYTVTITRAGGNEDLLSSLKLSAGTKNPVFTSPNTSYTDNVANSISSITVTPTAFDPNATIVVNETDAVVSGATSDPIALVVGPNVITVRVTAQDGTNAITYTVTVTRAAPPSDNTAYQPVGVEKPAETPTLADDGIQVHQGISPNADGINDFLQIDNISQYPDNKLSIMNRNGQLVYEANGYDNSSKVFDGHSNKNGQMQLPGTYFYQLDYTVSGITKHKTGFIILKY